MVIFLWAKYNKPIQFILYIKRIYDVPWTYYILNNSLPVWYSVGQFKWYQDYRGTKYIKIAHVHLLIQGKLEWIMKKLQGGGEKLVVHYPTMDSQLQEVCHGDSISLPPLAQGSCSWACAGSWYVDVHGEGGSWQEGSHRLPTLHRQAAVVPSELRDTHAPSWRPESPERGSDLSPTPRAQDRRLRPGKESSTWVGEDLQWHHHLSRPQLFLVTYCISYLSRANRL